MTVKQTNQPNDETFFVNRFTIKQFLLIEVKTKKNMKMKNSYTQQNNKAQEVFINET